MKILSFEEVFQDVLEEYLETMPKLWHVQKLKRYFLSLQEKRKSRLLESSQVRELLLATIKEMEETNEKVRSY